MKLQRKTRVKIEHFKRRALCLCQDCIFEKVILILFVFVLYFFSGLAYNFIDQYDLTYERGTITSFTVVDNKCYVSATSKKVFTNKPIEVTCAIKDNYAQAKIWFAITRLSKRIIIKINFMNYNKQI